MARRGWSKPLSGFATEVEKEQNRRLRAAAMQALSGVIERSPVKTGTFRGNNRVSVGSSEYGYDHNRQDASGSSTMAEGMQIIGRVNKAFDVIYVSNNLPYSEELEHGSSQQAPQGVYEVTFNSLRERYGR